MIQPNCETIEALCSQYDIIPLCKEIYADMTTPIALLCRIAQRSDSYFLLESVEGGEKWGRYSFLGYDPILRATCRNGVVTVEEKGCSRQVETTRPMDILRELLSHYRAPVLPDMPPFTGGFVGYFSYAMIGYAEPTLRISRGDAADFDLMLFDKVIAYDHLRQKIVLVANMKTDKMMENYGKTIAELEALAAFIRSERPVVPPRQQSRVPAFICNVSKEDYCIMVEEAKKYIQNGDIFQAVLSRRFESSFQGSLLNAYRVLRTTNPSPYMVYLHLDRETEIMSTSPETLVRLQNGRLTTFPVAGSRPRGKTEEQDKAMERELLADEKELSEHNMLVDLGRNDLGRISRYGSVEVTEYMMIHRYSKIMHICSQVEGDILPHHDGCSAIEAVLPAGTLSGAPKIRACEIIEELEQEPRGVYGGALGYLDFAGNMDTCIAIRMAVKQGGKVSVQSGGGIVADSIPEKEYEESANKAMAVINAIERAGEVED